MRRLEWVLLLAVAFGGLAWVRSNSARFEPLVKYGEIRAPAFYEEAARRAAARFGVNTSGEEAATGAWSTRITTARNARLRLAWERELVEPAWRLRSPYTVSVQFFGPERQTCRVTLDYGGNALGFEREVAGESGAPAEPAVTPPEEAVTQAREAALRAFRTSWRPPAGSEQVDFGFQLTADAVPDGKDLKFEWTGNPDPAGMVAWKVEATVREGVIQRFDLVPLILDNLRDRDRDLEAPVESGVLGLVTLGFAGVVWAFVVTIVNLLRKRLPWSFALRTAAAVLAVVALDMLVGGRLRSLPADWFRDGRALTDFLMGIAVNSCVAVALVCAGRSSRGASDFGRWLGVEDFLRLNWAKASVARGFWIAGILGMLGVAVPYVATIPFRDALFDSPNRNGLGLWLAFFEGISSLPAVAVLFAVAFCFPTVKSYVRWRSLRAVLALLLATAAAAPASLLDQPLAAILAWSAASGALMVYAYARFGVLATVLGGMFATPLRKALLLAAEGDATTQAWSAAYLVFAALVVAVALVLDLRNPAREEEQALTSEELERLQKESKRNVVSQREQLLGEFTEAQQAQQRMLPSQPPYVEGFEISAVCKPAQYVGGDLYDYIRLHDGRWACCVADVSGKGVSAALFMTLTKGLLNALRLERGDLAGIAARLNQSLYEVLRRRSFVTMSLVAIDPAARAVEVLRAGHLPLLHAGAAGEVRFVESKGMGLGLAPSGIFCRNLNTATVKMAPGEVAVLYSDGVTEAMNPKREEFGEDRLASLVAAVRERSAIEIRDHVMDEIARFQDGAPVHDDITVVVLKASDSAEQAMRRN